MEKSHRDQHKEHSKAYIQQKKAEKGHIRCDRCWLDKREHRCICLSLSAITFNLNVEFIVYMDHNEFMNPGDDAKLLQCVAPDRSAIYYYPSDDDLLIHRLNCINEEDKSKAWHDRRKISILFPNELALSFEEYVSKCLREDRDDTTLPTVNDPVIKNLKYVIIIVDGIWRRARKMAIHLREICPDIPHVQLNPHQLSVYARQQTQLDRICSIEALAFYLRCLGEEDVICQELVNAVVVNNNALKRKPQSKTVEKLSLHPTAADDKIS